jgi:hypothetical protein
MQVTLRGAALERADASVTPTTTVPASATPIAPAINFQFLMIPLRVAANVSSVRRRRR